MTRIDWLYPNLINYRVLGEKVEVNFEYADDYHVTLSRHDWELFCKHVGKHQVKFFFRQNYAEHRDDFVFEKTLTALGISYDRIAF